MCVWEGGRGGAGGSGGSNLGVILGYASQYFKTYPIHIPSLWKKGPIHILNGELNISCKYILE